MTVIALSPNFRLYVENESAVEFPGLAKAFIEGSGSGLLYLDRATEPVTEDPAFAYWKDFSRLYLSLFTTTQNLEKRDFKNDPVKIDLHPDDLCRFIIMAPPMKGAEYINEDSLALLWSEIGSNLQSEILKSGKAVNSMLKKTFILSRFIGSEEPSP